MSNINQTLASKLAAKNANEMELQEVRSLVATSIFNKLIYQSTDKLVEQAIEAGIEVDQKVILNTAIELLKEVVLGINHQTGKQGRCSDNCYYYWKDNVSQVINLLS